MSSGVQARGSVGRERGPGRGGERELRYLGMLAPWNKAWLVLPPALVERTSHAL